MPKSDLYVFKNDYEWYAATSIEDAYAIICDENGISPDAARHYYELEPMKDDEPLIIMCNEQGEPDDHGEPIEKRAVDWANHIGRGLMCSTEY